MIRNELEMVSTIMDYFREKKFIVWKEVPNMGQSADIVALKNHRYIFIEAKMKNWERAIEQCKAHELVADYIYIAIATENVSDNFNQKANSLGYGIIHINKKNKQFNISLRAKMNEKTWDPQREIFRTNLNKINNDY